MPCYLCLPYDVIASLPDDAATLLAKTTTKAPKAADFARVTAILRRFFVSSPTAKKSVALKWKALAVKAQAQRGEFDELENETHDPRKRSELEEVKKLIKGPDGRGAASNAIAQASIASLGGGGDGSSQAAVKWKKLLNASPRPDAEADESAKRLALLRDARKVKANKSKANLQEEDDPDIGQRLNKKTKRLEDAIPLIPKHLKKQLVGAKDYANFDKEFYKHFKFIFVDIPEADEDFPSESSQLPLHKCDSTSKYIATTLKVNYYPHTQLTFL